MEYSRLLQDSRQLNSRIRAGGHDNVFLPTLQRGLEQIEELSSQLAAKISASEASGLEARAALFLATKGYDAQHVARELRMLGGIVPSTASQTIGGGVFDVDVESYLRGELDGMVLGTLNRLDEAAVKEAEKIIQERSNNSWINVKKQMEEKGIVSDTGSIISNTTSLPKVAAYAKIIRQLNEARLKNSTVTLPNTFEGELCKIEGNDPRSEMLLDSWRALQWILNVAGKEGDNVFEYKDLQSSFKSNSKEWKRQLIMGSRRYLEDFYLRFVDRTLAQYPRDALLGGRPSGVERVRGFCEIKFKRMSPSELSSVEVLNNTPLWMVLFYLLRCGLVQDVLSFAHTFEHVINQQDPLFLAFLKAFCTSDERTVQGHLLSQLRLEYSQKLNVKVDPYKMALLKIMGRCDLTRRSLPEVLSSSEDYLWLQLWLIQDTLASDAEDTCGYSLTDLQKTITEFGARHFDPKGTNPMHYFKVLLLVGLFEAGIEYLYKQGQSVDAVHFAIALLQAGTIRLAPANDAIFTTNTQVNMGSMLTSYADSMATSDVVDGVNYLLLLSLNKTSEYDAVMHSAVRDLILQSGDFGALLGDVRHDGAVIPGLLTQYSRLINLRDEKAFMDVITVSAAGKCNKEGRFREALQLYNLAQKYDIVIDVLCARLSRAFDAPYMALEVDELKRTADSILNYYMSQVHISSSVSASSRNTCMALVKLLQVRKCYEEMRWSECLDILIKVNILPLEGDLASVTAASDRIRELSDNISTLLPELLVTAMTAIVRRAGELGGYAGIDSGRVQQVDLLKRMARNLMTFTGMLRLRVPQEVYVQLTRMEISIN